MKQHIKLSLVDILTIIVSLLSLLLILVSFFLPNARMDTLEYLDSVRINGEYSINGSNFIYYDTPENIYTGNAKVSTIIVRGHFDHDVAENREIMFHIDNMRIHIFINNALIYSYGDRDTYPSMAVSAGNVWSGFVSDGITIHDDIRIEMTNFYESSTRNVFANFLNSFYSGSQHTLFTKLRNASLPGFCLAIFVMIIGVIMLLASFVVRKRNMPFVKNMLYFGTFTFWAGCYILIDFDIFSMLSPYPFANNVICVISVLMLELFGALSMTTVFKSFFKDIMSAIAHIQIVYIFITVLVQFSGVMDLSMPLGISLALAILTAAIVFIGMLYEIFILKLKYTKTLMVSLSALALCGFAETLNYFTGIVEAGIIFKAGVLIFTITRSLSMFVLMFKSMEQLEKTKKMEIELAQSRLTVMLSQMKPHFIYNALNAISGLCLTDPLKADEAIVDFSDYLRSNITSLQSDKPIRFYEELEHIKHYAALEKLRFGDKINIEYDIGFSRFSLPTLTLQPIFENAIKHGIIKKPNGGTVKLSTRLDGSAVHIVVEDDGIGFDSEKIFSDADVASDSADAHVSVGLKNVKSRLKYLASADLTVKSEIGKGTVITIMIPLIRDTLNTKKQNGGENESLIR